MAVALLDAVKEAVSLLREVGVPAKHQNIFPQIFNVMPKIVITKPELMAASFADDNGSAFQASDLFLRYVAALRARDWPLVGLIEHEICSST